jgi:hypothetical protein
MGPDGDPTDRRILSDPGHVRDPQLQRQQGYYEMVLPDLVMDTADELGKLLDESLGERRPEIRQVVVGVVYLDDETGEGTAWKPLHSARWGSALVLARAIQINIENQID